MTSFLVAPEQTESDRNRQAALHAIGLDPFAATAFDDLARLAAEVFETPMASVSLIDRDRGRLTARVGIASWDSRQDDSLAALALRYPKEVLVVEDATLDERLRSEPFVTEGLGVRFYAAAPLTLSSGHAIGALCVMDPSPRTIDAGKLKRLKFLADQVIQTLEQRQLNAPC